VLIGMFSAEQNRDRLAAINCALRHDLSEAEREDLEVAKADIERWFIDLWLIEGGTIGTSWAEPDDIEDIPF
jgi:5'-deoxynucleotidase YfbR-like HD superfamily hydrolase